MFRWSKYKNMIIFTRFFVDKELFLDHIAEPLFSKIDPEECRGVVVLHILNNKIVCLWDKRDYISPRFCCVIEGRHNPYKILSSFDVPNTRYYDMVTIDNVEYMTNTFPSLTTDRHCIDIDDIIQFNIFSNSLTNMSISLSYSEIYKWYNTNQHLFTPTTTIQYLYVFHNPVTHHYLLSPNLGSVSLEFDTINTKYANVLQDLFGGTKMYIQVAPNDLYFVVPKTLNKRIFGDHYRVHVIQNYTPDWSLDNHVYKNMIDVHRTNFYKHGNGYRSHHNPKCIFKDKTLLFENNNQGLEFSNIECFNKRLTGNHTFNRTFTNPQERELIKNVFEFPYKSEMLKRHKAAKTIQRAWLKHTGRVQIGQRGGHFVMDDDKKKYIRGSIVDINVPSGVEYIHVICCKNGSEWDYSFMVYGKKGDVIDTGCFSGNRDHKGNLEAHFSSPKVIKGVF
jgi:hypothetical protein